MKFNLITKQITKNLKENHNFLLDFFYESKFLAQNFSYTVPSNTIPYGVLIQNNLSKEIFRYTNKNGLISMELYLGFN